MYEQDYSYLTDQLHARLQQARVSRTNRRDELFIRLHYTGPCSRQTLLNEIHPSDHESLYRNLRLFLCLDIAQEIKPGLFELSDRFKQHHHYLWCRVCNQAIPMYDPQLEKALMRTASVRKFALEDHRLELTGVCPKCRLDPSNQPKPAIKTRLRRYILQS